MSAFGRMLAESYEERAARIKREQRNRALGILSTFLAVGIFGATVGFIFGYRMGVDAGAANERAKPKKVVHIATPLTQWSCDPQERREYIHACAARIRSGAIKER